MPVLRDMDLSRVHHGRIEHLDVIACPTPQAANRAAGSVCEGFRIIRQQPRS